MKNTEETSIPTIEKSYYLHDQKKHVTFTAPNLDKMQEVVIDGRTKIYITLEADPEEARKRFLDKIEAKGKLHFASRKPVVT